MICQDCYLSIMKETGNLHSRANFSYLLFHIDSYSFNGPVVIPSPLHSYTYIHALPLLHLQLARHAAIREPSASHSCIHSGAISSSPRSAPTPWTCANSLSTRGHPLGNSMEILVYLSQTCAHSRPLAAGQSSMDISGQYMCIFPIQVYLSEPCLSSIPVFSRIADIGSTTKHW